jgi:ribosomal-protein-alanine N-acetyltransferase
MNVLGRLKGLISYDAEREFYGRIFPESVDQFALKQMRKMKPGDFPTVLAIERRVYEFPWTQGVFSDCLKTSGYSCWVCDTPDGRVLGYAIVSLVVGEAHIMNIGVDPNIQKRGVGRKMLHHLIETARNSKAETVFLEVRPSNHAAIELYRKTGFNEIGIRKGYYPAKNGREDALMLALTLLQAQAESSLD